MLASSGVLIVNAIGKAIVTMSIDQWWSGSYHKRVVVVSAKADGGS